MSNPSELWLRIEGDDFAVSSPGRYRNHVAIFPADRLVCLDESVLRIGVFVGAARPCQLRLESLPTLTPQFVIRYDRSSHWGLVGLDQDVFHNGDELADRTVTLQVGDTISCDPYVLRVVNPPNRIELLQELVERMLPANQPAEFNDDETGFLLNNA